jgi:hypothetical protein
VQTRTIQSLWLSGREVRRGATVKTISDELLRHGEIQIRFPTLDLAIDRISGRMGTNWKRSQHLGFVFVDRIGQNRNSPHRIFWIAVHPAETRSSSPGAIPGQWNHVTETAQRRPLSFPTSYLEACRLEWALDRIPKRLFLQWSSCCIESVARRRSRFAFSVNISACKAYFHIQKHCMFQAIWEFPGPPLLCCVAHLKPCRRLQICRQVRGWVR